MRTIPEASANLLRALAAERDLLQAQSQLLSHQRDALHAQLQAEMRRHDLDPDQHGVVTRSGAPFPLGTVVATATGLPIADVPPETTPEPETEARDALAEATQRLEAIDEDLRQMRAALEPAPEPESQLS